MTRQVRVDQDHCNTHLRIRLAEEQWRLLFGDPGRSSRGGAGRQGASLRIFESHGFRIPDLVMTRAGELLIVEVDARLAQGAPSLLSYRDNAATLLAAFSVVGGESLTELRTGFCRTGIVQTSPDNFIREVHAAGVDLAAWFAGPRDPQLSWAS